MITITPTATEQIKLSVEETDSKNMPLRIAAELTADKTLHYGMGFDEKKDDDTYTQYDGFEVIISPMSIELLKNTTLDYVELEPGKFEFIFMNPNDPEYKPPSEA